MGLDTYRVPPNDAYTICTSTTRPPVAEGRLIYETDTGRFMVYIDAGMWWPLDAEESAASSFGWDESGTQVGANDYGGTSWTTVCCQQSYTVPSWATFINWDVTWGISIISATGGWDFRLVWILSALKTVSSVALAASSGYTFTSRGQAAVGATGGPYSFVTQAQRSSGTGSIRQSCCNTSGRVWFT